MGLQRMQIGEVAEQTGLSLRTIRYYEEVGLASPSSRTSGGFRLYSDTDVARLHLVRRMKPLDFSLEEMKDVLTILDGLEDSGSPGADHDGLLRRLDMYRDAVNGRVRGLRDQLAAAEEFAADLRREIGRQRKLAIQTK